MFLNFSSAVFGFKSYFLLFFYFLLLQNW